MSKVKISGNASGTGVFTIAAPNSNTDYSLTLPETTGGEFVVTDSSGNVGIGASPSHILDVAKSGETITRFRSTTGDPSYTLYQNSDTGSTNLDGLLVGILGNESGYVFNYESQPLVFGTSNSERMRIDSSGTVFIGKTAEVSTTPGWQFKPTGEAIVGRAANDTIFIFQNTNTGSTVGSISITASATAYNTSSDYRLKEDWQPMSGSIDRLKNLNPVNFAWKTSGERVDGFLAHEAAEVVPEAVTGEKDAMRTEEYEVTPAVLDDDGNVVTEAVMGTREVPDYQGIDQSKLVPLLTAALQEAVAKIEALETRIAALEA